MADSRKSAENSNNEPGIASLIGSCVADTSAHGLPNIAKAKDTFRKLVWSAVTLILVSLWLWHSYSTIAGYLKFEVNIRTDIIPSRQLPNPAVTVCNKNAFDGMKARRFIDNMVEHTAQALNNNFPNASLYGPIWLPAWLEALAKNQNIQRFRSNGQLLQLYSEFMDMYGKIYGKEYRYFTSEYRKFIQHCQYQQEPCSQHSVRHKVTFNWLYGDCFTFFIDKNATGTGPRPGLQLTLFIDQKSYSGMTSDAGVQVVVHPPGQMPFPDEDGISVPPGQAAFIGVKMAKVKRLGENYGPCFDDTRQAKSLDYFKEHFYSSVYSLRTCERSCFQQNLMKRCNCLDNRYPPYITRLKDSGYENCITQYLSAFNFSNGLPENFGCKDRVEKMFNSFELDCDGVCHISCNTTVYDSVVSYSRWPSDAAMNETQESLLTKEAQNMSDEEFRKNFLQITVFFQSLSYELTTETQAITILQMLSDLGGNLGLYIGASLFTFFEFTQLLFDVMFWCRRRTRSRSRDATDVQNECRDMDEELYQSKLHT